MKEIGGYIELDSYNRPMLHEGAVALNCGRNALAYLIRARRIKKLYIPGFICDSIPEVCDREGTPYEKYKIGENLLPAQDVELKDGEWFYFVNYYSQAGNEKISEYACRYSRIIVDQAQSYFQEPLSGVDTLYTCRKYFGVADGAFLYTDAGSDEELKRDISFERMRFLLGRFEGSASEFYDEYVKNNAAFSNEPVMRMSRLTDNLLRAVDYGEIRKKRTDNFEHLHSELNGLNRLKLKKGSFMYPLWMKNGAELRIKLQEKKIYIPMLWPNVLESEAEDSTEYKLAADILPLPIDQRYGKEEMDMIVKAIRSLI